MSTVSYFENLTEPSGLVVSLASLKSWLKIDGIDDDTELTFILNAAQDKIAQYLGVTLLQHNIRGNYEGLEISKFEKYPFISFKRFPLDTMIQVAYWNGTTYTALTAGTDYVIKNRNSGYMRVLFKNTSALGSLSIADDIAYPIIIDATIGYETVPYLIQEAIKQYAAFIYDNKGDCMECSCDSDGMASLPSIIRAGISKYKIREVFS